MRIDFSRVEDVEAFASVPEGAYRVKVAEVRTSTTRDGDPLWGLLYFDDGAALYARRDVERPLPAFFERADPRTLTPPRLARANPELEQELRVAIERAPHSSIARFALASQLYAGGQVEAARALLAVAWRANPLQPAAPELAGRLAEEAEDREAALLWYQRTLEAAPIWTAVARRAEALEP